MNVILCPSLENTTTLPKFQNKIRSESTTSVVFEKRTNEFDGMETKQYIETLRWFTRGHVVKVS